MLHHIPKIKHLDSGNFFLIAGPCVIENSTMPFEIAAYLKELTDRLEIPFIFKASFKKANRSKLSSFSGIGIQKGLDILKEIGEKYQIPTITDIHTETDAAIVANYVDILQIPAFLCRQTDLLVNAAKTGKVVNIKKGQFLSPEAMRFAVEKMRESGNELVMLTERGTMFGYQDMIVDYRGIPVLQQNNVPVILDITHSLQQPNQEGGVTGGKPALIETIAKAGIAVGVDGLFMETHPNPSQAKSDGANMLPLEKVEELLVKLVKIRQAIR